MLAHNEKAGNDYAKSAGMRLTSLVKVRTARMMGQSCVKTLHSNRSAGFNAWKLDRGLNSGLLESGKA